MQQPFDRLGERLLAAGVAPRHVNRYLAELTEHLEDLKAEGNRAGQDRAHAEATALARLGAPDDLARAMIERPEFRSWATRTPWAAFVTFVIAPPLTLTMIFAMTVVSVVLFVQMHRPSPMAQPDLPGWFAALPAMMFQFERLVLPVLLGWGVAGLAIRHRILSLWPAIGLAVIAVFGAVCELSITLPSAGVHGEASFGMQLHGPEIVRSILNLALISAPYIAWRRFITGARNPRS